MPKELDIYIILPGEPTAGLRECYWTITGGVIIEDAEHREEIREAIKDAFEVITGGGHYVEFSDEGPPEMSEEEE